MTGGSPFSPVSWYTGNAAEFVRIGQDASASSCCSLEWNCRVGIEPSTEKRQCGASPGYYESDSSTGVEVLIYGDPSSSSGAGDQRVLDLSKRSTHCTALLAARNCTKASSSWNELKTSHVEANGSAKPNPLNVDVNGQRRCRPRYCDVKTGKLAQVEARERSRDFKPENPDDAYSHNLLSRNSGELEPGFQRTENVKQPELEILSSEYVCDRQKLGTVNVAGKGRGSKRKADEILNKGTHIEVQSESNGVKDSRIVRVSRLTGGKDRHSKVRTAKGLRDRRVRLSVPTAIQFYDLQDRLGYEQPSMAVDWLIKAAKAAIDDLPALEPEMATGTVCNSSHLASSNSSPAKCPLPSPNESATGLFEALGVYSTKNTQPTNGRRVNQKGEAQILNQVPISLMRQPELGKSSSSTSDGSIKGADTSNSALSKSASRIKARKEARERAKKKSSAKDFESQQINQIKSLQASVPGLCNNVVSNTSLAHEQTQCIGDNPYGAPNQVSSATPNIQQLLDSMSSYADILCQGSQQLQHMGSLCSSSAVMKQSSSPLSSSEVAAMGSSCLQKYEMAETGMPFFDPKPKQLGGNVQFHTSLHTNPTFVKQIDREQQQSQIQKMFASTFGATFSNDVNFSTSCQLSSRGPLQSNSSSVTYTPFLQKNAYGEASTEVHLVRHHGDNYFQGYDARIPERFRPEI
eukprot:Gb_07891 [translate_table: standard]